MLILSNVFNFQFINHNVCFSVSIANSCLYTMLLSPVQRLFSPVYVFQSKPVQRLFSLVYIFQSKMCKTVPLGWQLLFLFKWPHLYSSQEKKDLEFSRENQGRPQSDTGVGVKWRALRENMREYFIFKELKIV